MSSYTEVTQKLTDQWVAAVEQATEALPNSLDPSSALPASFELPDLSKLIPSGVIAGLPDAREVVKTNFRIAERLLAAQRDFTLAVIEKAAPKAAAAAAE